MTLLFERYDEASLRQRFEDFGVLEKLRSKGFGAFEVDIAHTDPALPHVRLRGCKEGLRHTLLDACLRRLEVHGERVFRSDAQADGALDLLLVQWVREEDPTSSFTAERPALPLQDHPGLGILRRVFRIASSIALDFGADGVANQPKFFHDAAIFHQARLFLFLDGREQGWFEAMVRDLGHLSMRDASLAVAGWCVTGAGDALVQWQPGLQVFPLSLRLTEHFHSEAYATDVEATREASWFRVDEVALAGVRAQLAACADGRCGSIPSLI